MEDLLLCIVCCVVFYEMGIDVEYFGCICVVYGELFLYYDVVLMMIVDIVVFDFVGNDDDFCILFVCIDVMCGLKEFIKLVMC